MAAWAPLGLIGMISLVCLPGCSADDGNPKDTGVGGDGDILIADSDIIHDAPLPPTTFDCDGVCIGFVLDRILLPDAENAAELGVDFNNDGEVDNYLGRGILVLSTIAPDVDFQTPVDTSINSGQLLHLLRIKETGAAGQETSTAQALMADSKSCCSDPQDPIVCADDAAKGCFGGSDTFTIATDSPLDMIFSGKIEENLMGFGPGKFKLLLPMLDAGVLDLNLSHARVNGRISADRTTITDGMIAGVATQENVEQSFVPICSKALTDIINDDSGKISEQTKATFKAYFDTNKDNQISESEFKANPIIAGFLSGDVDADGDGITEISVAVGFTAIKAIVVAGDENDALVVGDSAPFDDSGITPPDGKVATSDAGMH